MSTVRLVLPGHLRTLAHVVGDIELVVEGPLTLRTALDALEEEYPALLGTLRDHVTKQRRPFIRFFACERDLSFDSIDEPLPEAVIEGLEPLLVVGAIAGGRVPLARRMPFGTSGAGAVQ